MIRPGSFSHSTILLAGVFFALVLAVSSNSWLWMLAGSTLVAAFWLMGGRRTYPVLLWVVGLNWLSIIGAILDAELAGKTLADTNLGPYRVEAVLCNLCALLALAAGIRWGAPLRGGAGAITVQDNSALGGGHAVDLNRAALAYFASLLLVELVGFLAASLPSIQQPLIALIMLKYICIYLVAAATFKSGRGYFLLLGIIGIELVTGLTSFFASYKEPIFIVLIALATSGRRLTGRMRFFGAMSALLVVWISLMWTVIKPEYRYWVSGYTGEQIIVRSFEERFKWMADRLVFGEFDYGLATTKLVQRIDNTQIYTLLLARMDAGLSPDVPSRFLAGLEHVLMPRFLFPDKAVLNDSQVTTAMTGRVIHENTSISIGYIAEAHYDFGIPAMFLPVMLIGVTLGLAARYFMTRNAPLLIRQAFAAGGLFLFFQFGTNFNKALGSFLVGFIMLALVLKFGYPIVAKWLAGSGRAGPSGAAKPYSKPA